MKMLSRSLVRSACVASLALSAAAGCGGDEAPKTTGVREVDPEAVVKSQSDMKKFMDSHPGPVKPSPSR